MAPLSPVPAVPKSLHKKASKIEKAAMEDMSD